MTDDVKAAVERLREWYGEPGPYAQPFSVTSSVRDLLAHIDGEPARLAAAREMQASLDAVVAERDALRARLAAMGGAKP